MYVRAGVGTAAGAAESKVAYQSGWCRHPCRDLDAELLLAGHDDLDGVEAVEAEVVGEVGGGLDLWAG